MKTYISLKSKLLYLLLILPTVLYGQAKLGFEGEAHSSVGIYIKDLSSGKILAENDAEKALLPASIMKSITAAAALTTLGVDFQFDTPAYLYGSLDPADSGTWNGNLVIEASGDPTIDSELFSTRIPMRNEIAAGLKDLGIHTLNGNIIMAEPQQQQGWVPQWEIDDVAWSYGAGLFGFNYRDNYFTLWPATGRTRPYVPNLNLSVIQHDKGTDLYRGVFSNNLIVYGPEPSNPKWTTKVSMDHPAEVFESELLSTLKNGGIKVSGNSVNDETDKMMVSMHTSPLLPDILHEMMVNSHNLYAEGVLRAMIPYGKRADALEALDRALKKLGVNTKYNNICDGSGLARANRLQPKFISDVLEAMAKSPYAGTYTSLFPLVGKEGTVKGLLEKTSLVGKLALKSGSMNGVQCFAGYKLNSQGKPTHTVVIMVNSFFCSRGEVRRTIEKFLTDQFQN